MKIGDTVPVTIAGQTVAQAVVREMDKETATLVVPATLVVMGVRTELDAEATRESETSHELLGVESSDQQEETSEAAPVVEETPEVSSDDSTTTE